MAQQRKTTNNTSNITAATHQQLTPSTFHDFLGMKANNSPVLLALKTVDARFSDASSAASASPAASSVTFRGPISSTSDLGSVERQVGNHLEGIPFYGPRSDISGPEISNRLAEGKRSNSDSAFLGHDYIKSSHLMKMLKNGGGLERPRRSNDDEVPLGMQSLGASSASLILQPPAGNRGGDANISKWDRAIMPMNVGSVVHYPSFHGQFDPFLHQASTNRFKDTDNGPSATSQSAADEGSRTGIKGPRILSSPTTSGAVSEKNASGLLPIGGWLKSGIHIAESDSSVPPSGDSRQGLTSASRQMTIFYGGQAHVFDDVHPNKADVIMALAGYNGGSWSTTYSPKTTSGLVSDGFVHNGECEAVGNMAFSREFCRRVSVTGNTIQGTTSGDLLVPTGGVHQGSAIVTEDSRNPTQTAERGSEDKRDV